VLDPLSLVPLSLAAQRGRVDEFEAQQLVAAGLTLLQRSAPLVRALSRKRAALLLPTGPAFFSALAACEGRGAVLVNPLAAPAEIAHQLRDADVGAVFTTGNLAEALPTDVPRVLLDNAPRTARVSIAGASREIDLGSHRGMTIEGDPDVRGSTDEAAVIYTSAMAGTPLGAILSHRNLLANARSTVQATRLSGDDRVLALLPFAHLFGLNVTGTAPLLAGARVLTITRFNPAKAVDLMEQHAITVVAGVPAIFRALLAALARRQSPALGALRLCVCGGAPLTQALQEQWADATGIELRQGYGLTEAGPVCLFNPVDRANARGTLGVPFPGVDVELRSPIAYDATGAPRFTQAPDAPPSGATGAGSPPAGALEICVRGESVFRGYVSDNGRGLPVRDGWLHTGDLGVRTPGGQIAFAGVVKPMFTRNGFNVYPREIERVVGAMPGVERAIARDIPDDDGEPGIALEVAGRVTEAGVKAWCAERLSAYKQPTTIRVL
jgi:long-chain acyl-CoA synthetase